MKKYIYLISASLALISCGGGGGGSSLSEVVINSDAKEIAYKTDNGEWKTPNSKGTDSYSFKSDGKYKVALKCSSKEIYLVALNAKEDKEVFLNCDSFSLAPQTLTVTGALKDSVDNLSNFAVSIGKRWNLFSGNSYSLTNVEDGVQDILAVTLSSSPKRFIALRDKTIDKLNKNYDIDFKSTNSYKLNQKSFNNIGSTVSELILITKNGTYFTSAIAPNWYYPDGGLLNEDCFVKALAIKNNKTYKIEAIKATKIKKEDITNDISYISKLSSISYNGGVLSGLSAYSPSSKSLPFKGYIIDLENSNSQRYHILISNSYLGGDDDFAIDDLSTISGFGSVCKGDSANSVHASAVMVDRDLGNIFKSVKLFKRSGSGKLFYNLPYIVGETIELANEQVK